MNLQVVIGIGSAVVFLILLLWLLRRFLWVRVGEMETAVTFNVRRKAFSRFLLPGFHLLHAPFERVEGIYPTSANTVLGRCSRVQTREGVTASIGWTLVYRLDPPKIQPDMRPALARGVAGSLSPMLRDQGNNCVALLANERRVEEMFQNGRRGWFERTLRAQLQERLAPFGLLVIRFMVTDVELPPSVQTSLDEAHERTTFAESEARSLERLHQAIRQFSHTDMEWLLRLRQLQEMGQNGVTLHAPLVWPWMGPNSGPERGEERGNGRFPPDLPWQGHDGRRVG